VGMQQSNLISSFSVKLVNCRPMVCTIKINDPAPFLK
jgi:hypothetical protein